MAPPGSAARRPRRPAGALPLPAVSRARPATTMSSPQPQLLPLLLLALAALGPRAARADLIIADAAAAGWNGTLPVFARVVPRSVGYGLQAATRQNATVKVLAHGEAAAACAAFHDGDHDAAATVLTVDVLVVPPGVDYTCGGALPSYSADMPDFYCRFASAIVRANANVALGAYSLMRMRAAANPACVNAVGYLVGSSDAAMLLDGEAELPLFRGDLRVDELTEVDIISSAGVQFVLRVAVPVVYLLLAMRAANIARLRRRLARKAGKAVQQIPKVVLTVTTLSMIALSAVQMVGAHYTSSLTPVSVVILCFAEFPALTSSFDLLLAANYHQVCRKLQLTYTPASRKGKVVKYALRLSSAILLVGMGQALFFLSVPTNTAYFISQVLFPAFVMLTQITVTVVLVVQVQRMSALLNANVAADAGVGENSKKILQLEKHLRFWARVSIAGTVVQCIPSISLATDTILKHGTWFWLANVFFIKLSKAICTLAQIESMRPVKRKRRRKIYSSPVGTDSDKSTSVLSDHSSL